MEQCVDQKHVILALMLQPALIQDLNPVQHLYVQEVHAPEQALPPNPAQEILMGLFAEQQLAGPGAHAHILLHAQIQGQEQEAAQIIHAHQEHVHHLQELKPIQQDAIEILMGLYVGQ